MKLKKPKEGVMTKKYTKPNNMSRRIVADAVAEQIDDAVALWQKATVMFADSYGGASGVTLQVQTPSSWAYALDERNDLLTYWNEILDFKIADYTGGELVVRHGFAETIVAEVFFGMFNDAPVVNVHLGYLDLKQIGEWDASTYDEFLYDEVMRKAHCFLPDKETV
jgi:hypothetical protein